MEEKSLNELSAAVDAVFREHFGRTPLRLRLEDIFKEALELKSAQDIRSMQDEAGDLLCSAMALCAESGWRADELVRRTLDKIARRRGQYSALGRKTKVGILGGSFDPPTIGHVKMAKLAIKAGRLDEIWLMPAFDHMYGKKLVPADTRLEMLYAAIANEPMLKVFDYEVRHKMKGRMLHTVNRLLGDPDYADTCSFSLVVGRDVAEDVENWEGGLSVTDVIPFVVIDRAGSGPLNPNAWALRPPHQYIADESSEVPAVSSTIARAIVKAGTSSDGVLSPAVRAIVNAKNLYRQ